MGRVGRRLALGVVAVSALVDAAIDAEPWRLGASAHGVQLATNLVQWKPIDTTQSDVPRLPFVSDVPFPDSKKSSYVPITRCSLGSDRRAEPRLPQSGDPLDPDEVSVMAQRYNARSANCWRRSLKGTEGRTLADVKKTWVHVTIAPDGAVTKATLKGLPPGTMLETCLGNMMRAWRFRPSDGGTFAFTMLRPAD